MLNTAEQIDSVTAECLGKQVPTKSETDLLEEFPGLPLSAIRVPIGTKQADAALADLRNWIAIGFDTESKPTWSKEGIRLKNGPHLVQFATPECAYVFQLFRRECLSVVKKILEDDTTVKVGFALTDDAERIHKKLGVAMRSVLDMDTVFRADGYRSPTGVRAAVALVFNKRFHKSKAITRSNWALPQLDEQQLIYAANDAYVALRVLIALDRPIESLPVAGVFPIR